MIEQWQELKETITELRDNDGTGTQQEVCKFLVNYMDILEKQMQEPCDNILTLAERVVTQVTEDIDNFIFTTVQPWCEVKEQRIISKRDLEQALTQYFSKEPCEDAISRQAVINAIANTCFWLSSDNWKELIKCINSIPPVNPQEPKIGHWEWVQYDYNPKLGNWHCSECRCIVLECVDKETKGGIPLYKYCPQCGARMVNPQESEENK